jgi:hypothetical protein
VADSDSSASAGDARRISAEMPNGNGGGNGNGGNGDKPPGHYLHELPQIEEERLERLFKRLDMDGDGRIDIRDLTQALHDTGVHQGYAQVKPPRPLHPVSRGRKHPGLHGVADPLIAALDPLTPGEASRAV